MIGHLTANFACALRACPGRRAPGAAQCRKHGVPCGGRPGGQRHSHALRLDDLSEAVVFPKRCRNRVPFLVLGSAWRRTCDAQLSGGGRALLLREKREWTTVADAAVSCGYYHPGRFAAKNRPS